jgi:hypothetical protein
MKTDTPETIAYRLTQVENAVKELTKKIDGIISGFVTHKDIEVAKDQAKLEHDAIYEKIADTEKDVLAIKRRNWIQKTLSAILGSIITILLTYVLLDILKG